MAGPIDFRYRAFLSYAHADVRWAKWLHARLEGYRIDRDLVGRETAVGRVPKTLRPIFRDREDFSGGHSLTDATIVALDGSAALVVLCSPVAATRPAVNEEVRLFRSRHPDRPVIPVIVEGATPANFPPALRFELDADGSVSDRPVTILGPDLRDTADGRQLGLAKVVAGLTGLAVDDVRQRQLLADKRRIYAVSGIVAVFCGLSMFAGFLYLQHERQKVESAARDVALKTQLAAQKKQMEDQQAQLAALVQRLSLIGTARAGGAEQAIGQAVNDAASGARAGDQRLARALELLKSGKTKEAADLFRAVADEKVSRLSQDKKDAAAAYRNLGAIAGLADPKAAREAYAKALELAPDDREALYWHGYLGIWHDDRKGAQHSLARLLKLAMSDNDKWNIVRASTRLGQSMWKAGDNLTRALAHTDTAVDVSRGASPPAIKETSWQRELGEALVRRVDILQTLGRLDAAAKDAKESLAIRQRLAAADPGNAGWQRDLSVTHNKIGDVLAAQGNLPAALDAYKASHAIAERLAAADPRNAGWQRDLSVSNERMGDIYVAQGNLTAALEQYRASLDRMVPLRDADVSNADLQRFTSVTHEKIGDVLVAQGNLAAALDAYKARHAIAERLAAADPGNAGWQRDLWVSYWRLAKYEPATYWPKAVAKLEDMEKRGILLPTDRQYLETARRELAKLK
ncbi:MAG: hypothetical protein RLZ98_2155 [Pseudomonadota bacterium]|jgi:tetratricopeptide (TPR) repeat protein